MKKKSKNQLTPNKENQQESRNLTIELIIVPQGTMIKPETYLASIDTNSLKSFIKETIIDDVKNNSEIRKTLKQYL